MTIQAQLTWTDGLQLVARADGAPAIIMDNPVGGSGPTPMQVMLMGIAGCTAMDVISILNKKRCPFTRVTANVVGERADGHPKRFTRIRIEYVVHGNGVKPKDVERAIELSTTRYCGAIASLDTPVENTFRIEQGL